MTLHITDIPDEIVRLMDSATLSTADLTSLGVRWQSGMRHGVIEDWTGRKCAPCEGRGQRADWSPCFACGGTGDEYGPVIRVEE